MRLVCSTLGVARSHLVALRKRPDNWTDAARHAAGRMTRRCWKTFGTSFAASASMATDGSGAYCDISIPERLDSLLTTNASIG